MMEDLQTYTQDRREILSVYLRFGNVDFSSVY